MNLIFLGFTATLFRESKLHPRFKAVTFRVHFTLYQGIVFMNRLARENIKTAMPFKAFRIVGWLAKYFFLWPFFIECHAVLARGCFSLQRMPLQRSSSIQTR
jgi:hypothetical protein